MQRYVVILALVSAGCRLRLGLQAPPPAPIADFGDVAADDLGTGAGGPGDDLATAMPPDLATPPDLLPDPCGAPTALGSGNVPAQCVIGNPPAIDGNLADWPPLSQFASLTKSNAAVGDGAWNDDPSQDDPDLSGKYFVRWDLSYVYVAVAVTDDILSTPNSFPQLTDNDAVELFFNGKHDQDGSYDKADDWQLVYSSDTKMASGQPTAQAWPSSPANKAALVKAVAGQGGSRTVEFAVPWSILGNITPTASALVGFDLKLDDNDGDGATRDRDLILFETVAGTAPITSTATFGTVQLMGR